MNVQLIYTSLSTTEIVPETMEAILASSRRNNGEACLTGMLCYAEETFLQCLEGARHKVNETYRRICRDPRHRDTTLLRYDEIEHRIFPGWSMGYAGTLEGARLFQRVGLTRFNPLELDGKTAQRLLLDLKSELSEQSPSH